MSLANARPARPSQKRTLHAASKVGLAVCCLTLIVPAAIAHHAPSLYFTGQSITVKGTVTEIQWVKPHAWAHIDVKKDGKAENWVVELDSVNRLIKAGWAREKVKAGDLITITGPRGNERTVGLYKATVDPSGQPRAVLLMD